MRLRSPNYLPGTSKIYATGVAGNEPSSHEGRLAEILGNSPAIVQRHYKGLTTKNEGQKYFGIVPVREGNILQLKTAKQENKAA